MTQLVNARTQCYWNIVGATYPTRLPLLEEYLAEGGTVEQYGPEADEALSYSLYLSSTSLRQRELARQIGGGAIKEATRWTGMFFDGVLLN